MRHPIRLPLIAALLLTALPAASEPVTPSSIVATAPASDWRRIAPDDLLVIELEGGGQVAIQLAEGFAPVHLDNVRKLARAHWYDGASIERVQDNYVTQWGDPDGKKPLPPNIDRKAPAEYDRPAAGLRFDPLPYRDTFADKVGFSDGLPTAETGGEAWLTHCYGMVGVGRDMNPDTGTGAELYAVIGHSPRHLDRNVPLLGRVLTGMERLAALPRGTAELGMYADPKQRIPIRQVRLAADLPPAERPVIEVMRTDSGSYRAWVHARANRQDSFFLHPAGAVDLCNAMPPVRVVTPAG